MTNPGVAQSTHSKHQDGWKPAYVSFLIPLSFLFWPLPSGEFRGLSPPSMHSGSVFWA